MPGSHDPRYLLRWDHSRGLEIGRDIVVTRHRIGELPLATHQRLADIIDEHPRDAVSVHTMGTNPSHKSQWRRGQLGRVNGRQLIDAVENRRLWIALENADRFQESIRSTSQRLMQEIADCHVGLRISDLRTKLIFASPGAIQYYRCDPRPTIRWQLHGQQTVLAYPSRAPFLRQSTFEDVCISGAGNRIYFEPAFDEHAERLRVEPTQMISLPQSTPYRVTCAGLSVWLQTEYDDQASIRYRNISQANRTLRQWLPAAWCEHQTTGLTASLKNALGEISRSSCKYLACNDSADSPTDHPSFTVEAAPCLSSARPFVPDTPLLPATTNTTPVVLEN